MAKTKILCGAVDCEYNGDENVCDADSISLCDLYLQTRYGGLAHVWKCKKYKESNESKEMRQMFGDFLLSKAGGPRK